MVLVLVWDFFRGREKVILYLRTSPPAGGDSEEIERDLRTSPALPVSGGKHAHADTHWHKPVADPPTLSPIPYILEWDHPHSRLITSLPLWPLAQHPSPLFSPLHFPPPAIHHHSPSVFLSTSLFISPPPSWVSATVNLSLPSCLPLPLIFPPLPLTAHSSFSLYTCVACVCQNNLWWCDSDKPCSYLPTRGLTSTHYSTPANHPFTGVRLLSVCVCVCFCWDYWYWFNLSTSPPPNFPPLVSVFLLLFSSLSSSHLQPLPQPPFPAPAAGPGSHREGQAGHPSRDEHHHKGTMFQPQARPLGLMTAR